MTTDTNATTTPEAPEPIRPSSKTPMTFRVFWKSVVPYVLERINELISRDTRRIQQIAQLSQEVELLKALCLSLKSEIDSLQTREGYELRNAEAREATNAAIDGLREAIADHGDQGSRSRMYVAEKCPPGEKSELRKSLGMGDNENL